MGGHTGRRMGCLRREAPMNKREMLMEILGGIVVMASIAIIMLGMMLL